MCELPLASSAAAEVPAPSLKLAAPRHDDPELDKWLALGPRTRYTSSTYPNRGPPTVPPRGRPACEVLLYAAPPADFMFRDYPRTRCACGPSGPVVTDASRHPARRLRRPPAIDHRRPPRRDPRRHPRQRRP